MDKGRGRGRGEGGEEEDQGRGGKREGRQRGGEGKGEAAGGLRTHFSRSHLHRVEEERPPSFLAGLSFPSEPQSPPPP